MMMRRVCMSRRSIARKRPDLSHHCKLHCLAQVLDAAQWRAIDTMETLNAA